MNPYIQGRIGLFAVVSAVCVSLFCSGLVQAGVAGATLDQVKDAFEDRVGDLSAANPYNTAKLDQAFTLAQQAEREAGTDAKSKYQALIWQSAILGIRGYYIESDKSKRIEKIEAMIAKATAAVQADSSFAGGYYFVGLSKALWLNEKGTMGALTKPGYLADIDNAFKAIPGKAIGSVIEGLELQWKGAQRVQGRVFDMAARSGFSRGNPEPLLKAAYEGAPRHVLGATYYADYLANKGRADEACAILGPIATMKDPGSFEPLRGPETVSDLKETKKLYNARCSR